MFIPSLVLFTIFFLNVFEFIFSHNFRKDIKLQEKLDDINIDISLSEEISLYKLNVNEILDCIKLYYENIQKNDKYYLKNHANFEEYRDYWKPYSLKWVCKKIKNNIDL